MLQPVLVKTDADIYSAAGQVFTSILSRTSANGRISVHTRALYFPAEFWKHQTSLCLASICAFGTAQPITKSTYFGTRIAYPKCGQPSANFIAGEDVCPGQRAGALAQSMTLPESTHLDSSFAENSDEFRNILFEAILKLPSRARHGVSASAGLIRNYQGFQVNWRHTRHRRWTPSEGTASDSRKTDGENLRNCRPAASGTNPKPVPTCQLSSNSKVASYRKLNSRNEIIAAMHNLYSLNTMAVPSNEVDEGWPAARPASSAVSELISSLRAGPFANPDLVEGILYDQQACVDIQAAIANGDRALEDAIWRMVCVGSHGFKLPFPCELAEQLLLPAIFARVSRRHAQRLRNELEWQTLVALCMAGQRNQQELQVICSIAVSIMEKQHSHLLVGLVHRLSQKKLPDHESAISNLLIVSILTEQLNAGNSQKDQIATG